ncbi:MULTISPECIES: rhodanese-like domain-containing protein [Myxococcaceae]|uniref:rhodanese-like domain-containing protein n=1 Tax=Myxococcaceae TaxID=31 RepID=UPI001890795F|nr:MULTISPECIES: rhodanese-like domain-containing protein [Myxococcaceae]MBF5045829.1 rhodanese-like domain-containing protein [Simulacricoccus sp. 17bor-14]
MAHPEASVISLAPLSPPLPGELDTLALCILLLEEPLSFTLLEVLPTALFALGHLPGALSAPAHRLHRLAPQLLPDREATVIVYGSGRGCTALREARETLAALGYTRVLSYPGGKRAWAAEALPFIR